MKKHLHKEMLLKLSTHALHCSVLPILVPLLLLSPSDRHGRTLFIPLSKHLSQNENFYHVIYQRSLPEATQSPLASVYTLKTPLYWCSLQCPSSFSSNVMSKTGHCTQAKPQQCQVEQNNYLSVLPKTLLLIYCQTTFAFLYKL